MARSVLFSAVLALGVASLGGCVRPPPSSDTSGSSSATASPRPAGLAADVALDEAFDAGTLNLIVRSGEVTLRGGDDGRIVVRCSGRNAQRCAELRTELHAGNLEISGGPRNIAMEINVPAQLGLRVRMPAGELNIAGIRGDKDVRLRAGEVNIDVSDPHEYGPVKASVLAGEISARAFGGSAEGIFRHYDHSGDGRYRLSARLLAGEITFR
jgi:hypothetical protein